MLPNQFLSTCWFSASVAAAAAPVVPIYRLQIFLLTLRLSSRRLLSLYLCCRVLSIFVADFLTLFLLLLLLLLPLSQVPRIGRRAGAKMYSSIFQFRVVTQLAAM